MLSFKPTFSFSSFTFLKRLFSSSSLSVIRVVSSAYLRLLIFFPAILIPACASSSKAFHMMYSAYKLNKLGDNTTLTYYSFPNLEPVHCSISGSNCCFLTCNRFLRRQVRWSGFPNLFKNFPVCCDPHKSSGIVNKTEVDVFLELSCCFDDPVDVGHLISGSSAFSKSSLNIRKFTVHVLLKPGLENFEHYFTSVLLSATVR